MFTGAIYLIKTSYMYNKKYVIFVFIREIITMLVSITNLFIPQMILDIVFIKKEYTTSIKAIIIFLIINSILGLIINMLDSKILIEKMVAYHNFQLQLAEKMLKVSYEEIENEYFLNLKNKAEQFLNPDGRGFGSILESMVELIAKTIYLITTIGIIVTLNPILILFLISFIIIDTALNTVIYKKITKLRLEKSPHERRTKYYTDIFQDFNYGKDIRVYNLGDWLIKKFSEQIYKVLKFYKEISQKQFKASNFSLIFYIIQTLISYLFLINSTSKGELTVGQFTLYLTTITSFTSTLKYIINNLSKLNIYTDYFDSFKTYINLNNQIDKKFSTIPDLKNFVIRFDNVSFKYKNSKYYALKNISVKIKSNQITSIVGKNGSGKSTFIKLLMRIYNPTKGQIFINNINIEDISLQYYWGIMATVFQDYKLFSFSINQNIILENSKDDNKLSEIFKLLNIDKIIDALPNVGESFIYKDFDENGFVPSGGISQKIAIARAMYKDSKIIIMDEASSSLDPLAEYEFNNNLLKHFKKKTCIIISHRLSICKECDTIILFEEGKIKEVGSHEKLISNKYKYYELYNIQSTPYKKTPKS